MSEPIEDQPIHHLLSITKNPAVKDMSTEELNAYITRLRVVATSPQTMSATLQTESKRKRPKTEAQLRREKILAEI